MKTKPSLLWFLLTGFAGADLVSNAAWPVFTSFLRDQPALGILGAFGVFAIFAVTALPLGCLVCTVDPFSESEFDRVIQEVAGTLLIFISMLTVLIDPILMLFYGLIFPVFVCCGLAGHFIGVSAREDPSRGRGEMSCPPDRIILR